MPTITSDSEAWKKMVLRSMPPPAWLSVDAPSQDVVLSTRVRFARNVRHFAFPHRLAPEELRNVQRRLHGAATESGLKLNVLKRISEAERDYLIGCRLISPEFPHREHGRVVLLDDARALSIMVNEEDHLRLQALTAGWSIETCIHQAQLALNTLSERVDWSHHQEIGFLTASPHNAGLGRRISVMTHLVGLAQTNKLTKVLQAIASSNLIVRGLFGESSRAVGAFFQISSQTSSEADFVGACEYVISEERAARRNFGLDQLHTKAEQAMDYAVARSELSMADALRVMAWVRWGSAQQLPFAPASTRTVDGWLTTLEVRGTTDPQVAARRRADAVRTLLGR